MINLGFLPAGAGLVKLKLVMVVVSPHEESGRRQEDSDKGDDDVLDQDELSAISCQRSAVRKRIDCKLRQSSLTPRGMRRYGVSSRN